MTASDNKRNIMDENEDIWSSDEMAALDAELSEATSDLVIPDEVTPARRSDPREALLEGMTKDEIHRAMALSNAAFMVAYQIGQVWSDLMPIETTLDDGTPILVMGGPGPGFTEDHPTVVPVAILVNDRLSERIEDVEAPDGTMLHFMSHWELGGHECRPGSRCCRSRP